MSDLVSIYMTAPSREVGEQVAMELVNRGLIACANIFDGVTSIYCWEGKVTRESEVIIIAKGRAALFADLEKLVLSLHPYSCPCILTLPILTGHGPYLDWIRDCTRSGDRSS